MSTSSNLPHRSIADPECSIPLRNTFGFNSGPRAKTVNQDDIPEIDLNVATEDEIRRWIETYLDDMDRLSSDCPKYPLRDEHMQDPLIQGGIKTSKMRCYRDYTRRCTVEELAYCDHHERREFSVTPTILHRPINGAQSVQQRRLGGTIVRFAGFIPVLGLLVLHVIAVQDPIANQLIYRLSGGTVTSFDGQAIQRADTNLLWAEGLWAFAILVALVVLLIVYFE